MHVFFAGGGTGGHIFPALAIAEELTDMAAGSGQADEPRELRCTVLCSQRPIDAGILSRRHVPHEALPARPPGWQPGAAWRFATGWVASVRRVRAMLAAARSVGAVVKLVALGGFVAPPAVRAAVLEHVPVMLVNLDAVPGRANRWIARRAQHVVTTAEVGIPTWQRIHPIVRREAVAAGDAGMCRRALGLDPFRRTLLVTGASQGARSINRLMVRLLDEQRPVFAGWQVIHQTGAGDQEEAALAYARADVPAHVVPFLDRMGLAWGSADVALCRAGAGTVAEAWANRIPAVFLPYPYHRDRHQRFNAQPLVSAGGAVVVEDCVDDARNAANAGLVLTTLLGDPDRLAAMQAAMRSLPPADGARRVAELLLAAS